RLPFISAKVFKDLGFNFASVLEITSPELLSLTLGTAISDSLSPHSAGTYINQDGTIYLINFDGTKSGIPSLEVYNSFNIDGDFSRVVPANSADRLLPMGPLLIKRTLE